VKLTYQYCLFFPGFDGEVGFRMRMVEEEKQDEVYVVISLVVLMLIAMVGLFRPLQAHADRNSEHPSTRVGERQLASTLTNTSATLSFP
jgi:hypothetical protein